MAKGFSMEGFERVIASLRSRSLKGGKTAQVIVGYETPYALKVHEDMEMSHPHGGQAKFLEQPFRQNQALMRDTIQQNLENKESLATALRRAVQIPFEESQQLVPVQTGALKASGFIDITD